MNQEKKRRIEHWQWISVVLIGYDAVVTALSFFLALLLRFDFQTSSIPHNYWYIFRNTIFWYLIATILIFWLFRLYRILWQHFGIEGFLRCIAAAVVALVVYVIGTGIFTGLMPASFYVFGFFFQTCFIVGIRIAYRLMLMVREKNRSRDSTIPVMIIGAGSAGLMMKRNLEVAKEVNEKVVCFIDDNPNKKGRFIGSTKVYGDRTCIFDAVDKLNIKKIYLAIPSATASERRDLLNICKETGCEIKALKGLDQMHDATVTMKDVKDVAIEDLLGREPVKIDVGGLLRRSEGKSFLVTGAGGSIGSELARQIASHRPGKLILFDIYENGVYDVQLELKKKYPQLDLVVLIGSVRDERRMMSIFSTYRPQFVFHAAAHKHVPLMEDSPCEAIKNNALGTYKTAYAAMAHGCEKFVLISTDKAVNPVNIMGASKRICEMIIQTFAKAVREGTADKLPDPAMYEGFGNELDPLLKEKLAESRTQFSAVRFGNVLGSNGSVIPIFKRQIQEGGPVTVTHPDIIRYFMTIPEAVSLVLDASVYASDGEIYVLDMGEPVKIDTLARNLIKLSGLKPDEDIKILYTGLRPGEKLYEERLMDEEGLKKTANKMVSVAQPLNIETDKFLDQLVSLSKVAYIGDEETKRVVAETVLTYNPQSTL